MQTAINCESLIMFPFDVSIHHLALVMIKAEILKTKDEHKNIQTRSHPRTYILFPTETFAGKRA